MSQPIGLFAVGILIAARGKGAPDLGRLLPAAAGGLAGIAALTAFYRALAIGTMSIVAPIAATGVVLPVAVGVAGGDRPAVVQVVGIIAATAGVVLASREVAAEGEARRISRLSVLLALVAALGFGSFAVGLRPSARADVLWALLSARISAVALVAAAFAVRRPRMRGGRSLILPLAATGILDVSANGLYAVATRHGLLSIVAVASSLYPLVTVLLARVVLGEQVRRIQELGIAAAVAGIVLIAAG